MEQIILVDMDNVIADFNGYLKKCLLEHVPEVKPISDDKFYFEDNYPEDMRSLIRNIYNTPAFFLCIKAIDGAIEALKEMEEIFHVYICTSPLLTNPTCLDDKKCWVIDELGSKWEERMITSRDKTLVRGDILIDDKSDISGIVDPSWEHIVYDQAHNRSDLNKRRLDWSNWKEVLL